MAPKRAARHSKGPKKDASKDAFTDASRDACSDGGKDGKDHGPAKPVNKNECTVCHFEPTRYSLQEHQRRGHYRCETCDVVVGVEEWMSHFYATQHRRHKGYRAPGERKDRPDAVCKERLHC